MTEKNRKGVNLLDEMLERRMLLYVLAAGATLGGVPAAQAKVAFTPSNTVLNLNNPPLEIDLNHDGVTDFVIHDFHSSRYVSGTSAVRRLRRPPNGSYEIFNELDVQGQGSNAIMTGPPQQALALPIGATIGGSGSFSPFGSMVDVGFVGSLGNFRNVNQRSLGVRFLINGEVHYGWIGFRSVRVGVTDGTFALKAKLFGWAYETEPNKTIVVGAKGEDDSAALRSTEPTSLELLALGHTGIADRQRRIAARTTG